MPLSQLTVAELEVIRQCLQAAATGPFYPDWEFSTLFGVTRETVRQVLADFPTVDDADESVKLSINNSMNLLWFYPHDCGEVWDQYFSVSEQEMKRVFL